VKALEGVFRSPVAFHDRTPNGRITSRLAKDVDELDTVLPFAWALVSRTPCKSRIWLIPPAPAVVGQSF
jgi:ABC-type multidrug transport system fused ATPase/permease subunit